MESSNYKLGCLDKEKWDTEWKKQTERKMNFDVSAGQKLTNLDHFVDQEDNVYGKKIRNM